MAKKKKPVKKVEEAPVEEAPVVEETPAVEEAPKAAPKAAAKWTAEDEATYVDFPGGSPGFFKRWKAGLTEGQYELYKHKRGIE